MSLPLRTSVLFVVLTNSLLPSLLANDSPKRSADQDQARRWVRAKFDGETIIPAETGHLTVSLKTGRLLKNMATTKVYHKEIGALPLKIFDKTYRKGLYCPSIGEIVVHLPGPAKNFEAVFGIDSNRVESFYSNANQGSVIGTVEANGEKLFESKVMREGIAGQPVKVALSGATEFKLSMRDAGQGVVERVDFNQADWADAKVELENGQTIWVGDLPISPLAKTPESVAPFSFVYDGQDSRQFLSSWDRETRTRKLDEERTEHTLTFRDPHSGLQVRCVGIEYQDFPVVEWKLFFKNTGETSTPIIQDILPLDIDFERDNEGEFVLHHNNGSPHSLVKMSDETDYAPRSTRLAPKTTLELGSKIGLPASNDLPFFNIEFNSRGIIGAIGWPGQWKAMMTRDSDRGLELRAGQELTHFKLLPGEEVRSPLIALMFWQGDDWLDAQNLWRRWMIAHSLPRTADGKLPPPQHAASSSAYYMESTEATEENQIMFINRYLEEGLKPDYWWIDAGWYEYDDYWLNVGTWTPNKERFPRGLKPISDHLHKHGVEMILWFTPEVVARGSYIDREHPEWMLKGGAEWWMGHALFQGEVAGHVNDSGLTLIENVAAFGIGNPTVTVVGRTHLDDGKWHLVTATRRIDKTAGRSELRLFVDGKLDAVGFSSNTAPLTANDSWGFGRQYQNRGIVGQLDDARIYDRALSDEQVEALFRRADTIPARHHYAFDGSLTDNIQGTDGEFIGTGELNFSKGATKSANDRSLVFNNDYGVKIKNDVPNDFTLSCWVRMDAPQAPPWGRGDFRLVNFGNPEAVKWMVDYIDERINEHGVDFYRHDGMPPLQYWRANDAPDRQGISEIKHIEGLLRFWDELRRRHPMIRIDICSGGGSRNELETLRRAVPLWRSDYAYEPIGMQALTYGMAMWIPYFGTGIMASDAYTFRSQLAPATSISWDVRRKDVDYDFRRKMLTQSRAVLDNYYGDFYPLTAYRTDDDVWMAWQFNRPDQGVGMLQAFRRPKSSALSMQFKLRGLEANAWYQITNMDDNKPVTMKGQSLMNDGLIINLPQPRSSALLTYERIHHDNKPSDESIKQKSKR